MKFLQKASLILALLASCTGNKSNTRSDDDSSHVRTPAKEAFRENAPKPSEAKSPKLPSFTMEKLSNGLTLIVGARPGLPIVDVRMIFSAGAAYEDAGQAGIAGFTFDLLDEGAAKKDPFQLADASAKLGATLRSGAGLASGAVTMRILKRNLDDGMTLLTDIVRKPRFKKADFQRLKARRLSALKQRKGNPNAIAADVFSAAVFGPSHPYGHPASGTEKTVRGISLRDITSYWKKQAGPKNAALIFVGDVTLAEARAIAERHFGSWSGRAQRAPAPTDPAVSPAQVHVVNVAGTPQTVVRIGRPFLRRGDKDEFAAEIMNRILGGMFSSRLNMKLREEKQFTYGAFSRLGPGRGVGAFSAGAGIKINHTAEALTDFFAEFTRLHDEQPSQGEIDAAKDNFIKSLPVRFETVGAAAAAASEIFLYDLPADYFQTLPAAIDAVSAEDIARVAKMALDKGKQQIVLVGDTSVFLDDVKALKLGEVKIITP